MTQTEEERRASKKASAAKYRASHADEIRAHKAATKDKRSVYYHSNKERFAAQRHERYMVNRESELAQDREYYQKHKEEKRQKSRIRYAGAQEANWERGIRRNYGLSPEKYAGLLMDQGGVCKICGAASPGGRRQRFCVDHSHETGEVRGLLCGQCNSLLGHAHDDRSVLASADLYLRGMT